MYSNPLYTHKIEVAEFELLTEFTVGEEVRRKFRMVEQLNLDIEYAIYRDAVRTDKRYSHVITFICRGQAREVLGSEIDAAELALLLDRFNIEPVREYDLDLGLDKQSEDEETGAGTRSDSNCQKLGLCAD